jgi:thiamine-phosphate diphosphorylase
VIRDSPFTIDLVLSPLNPIVDVDVAARAGWMPLDLLQAYLDGGATFVQIRAKRFESGALLELCDAAVVRTQAYQGQIVVNDRVDVARLAGAAGVHVGQDDLPPLQARELLGPAAIVGVSTHTLPQAEAALEQPVTYVAVGPVFGTRTKDTGYEAVGLDLVSAVARRNGALPVVAIGGITIDTAVSVLEAGATSVAIIGDLLATGDPAARVADYLRLLAGHRV